MKEIARWNEIMLFTNGNDKIESKTMREYFALKCHKELVQLRACKNAKKYRVTTNKNYPAMFQRKIIFEHVKKHPFDALCKIFCSFFWLYRESKPKVNIPCLFFASVLSFKNHFTTTRFSTLHGAFTKDGSSVDYSFGIAPYHFP